jgi:hypothetical protein
VLNSNAYVIKYFMRVATIISHVIYCCSLLIFWLKTKKCCQTFDKNFKFNKYMSNLVKCCQNAASKSFKKPKVSFYSARNKNRTKFAMLIKNKTGFAKGMNIFLYVI